METWTRILIVVLSLAAIGIAASEFVTWRKKNERDKK